jgi:hypothetical protein
MHQTRTIGSHADLLTDFDDACHGLDGDVYIAEVADLLLSQGRALASDAERAHVSLCYFMGLPAAECIAHLDRAEAFLQDALEDAGYSRETEGRQ